MASGATFAKQQADRKLIRTQKRSRDKAKTGPRAPKTKKSQMGHFRDLKANCPGCYNLESELILSGLEGREKMEGGDEKDCSFIFLARSKTFQCQ